VKRRSWKVWVAGIALAQLLAIGVDVALWPTITEAEQVASRLWLGMTADQATQVVDEWYSQQAVSFRPDRWSKFSDGSSLALYLSQEALTGGDAYVVNIRAIPPPSVHPLTRLRRTLARAFPFLGE
jgi:hypothetical protein